LKNEIVKATIWSLLDTYVVIAMKFIFAIAITRILTPHDYGLFAYMGLFLVVATFLSEGGFGTALIQKKDATDIDYSTAYIFNLSIGVFFFLLYFSFAGLVSDFFKEPELKLIMRVTSINLILNCMCYVHLFKLIKLLQSRKQAIINFLSSLISGLIGLYIAIIYKNYWALVIQTLTSSFVRMVGLWLVVKWIPMLKFSFFSFYQQYKFGFKVFFQGLIESISKEIYSLIIGKNFSTIALGNYSRGQNIYLLFIVQTGIAFNKILYPSMAKESENRIAHKNLYFKTYNLLFFFMAPLSLFLILLSEPLVHVLLTDKWIETVPFMQLFFFAGFIFLLIMFNSTTVLSANNAGLYLKMDIFHKILLIVTLIITYKISIISIIIGWLIVYYIYYFAYEIIMYRQKYYSFRKYIMMFQVILCMLPSIFIFYVTKFCIMQPIWLIIANAILQPISYLGIMRICRFDIYKNFSEVAFNLLPIKLRWLV
jgi:teichuronic acid exporter